jgi:hypothetical protein
MFLPPPPLYYFPLPPPLSKSPLSCYHIFLGIPTSSSCVPSHSSTPIFQSLRLLYFLFLLSYIPTSFSLRYPLPPLLHFHFILLYFFLL